MHNNYHSFVLRVTYRIWQIVYARRVYTERGQKGICEIRVPKKSEWNRTLLYRVNWMHSSFFVSCFNSRRNRSQDLYNTKTCFFLFIIKDVLRGCVTHLIQEKGKKRKDTLIDSSRISRETCFFFWISCIHILCCSLVVRPSLTHRTCRDKVDKRN